MPSRLRSFAPRTAVLAIQVALFAFASDAATITGLNTNNLTIGATSADGVTGFTEIYDRDPSDAGALTNGKIAFTPPEASSPGVKVVNGTFPLSGPNPGALATTGCIMASSTATCDSEFQSGKRFKEIITKASAPVDLVFDVAAEGVQQGGAGYQVFHRLVNQTQSRLTGFTLELGFGVGENFVQSTGGDGLGFSTVFTSGPDGANAFTQYPFGLFGDAASNPNFTLDGFFSPTRAGFDVALLEDIMFSTGYYGPYKGQFGNWLSSEMTPSGGFYDDDGDPDTDAILMAWLNVDNVWEVRRELDQFDEVVSRAPITFSSLADASTFLGVTLEELSIEDLANLNLNFAIALDAGTVGFNEFTLRVGVQPVPLPASAPILIVALGLLGMMTRSRA